jgi:hypothetical protein
LRPAKKAFWAFTGDKPHTRSAAIKVNMKAIFFMIAPLKILIFFFLCSPPVIRAAGSG